MEMKEPKLGISEIYAKGRAKLEEIGFHRVYPPDSPIDASISANRKYLDSIFFRTKFLNPVSVETSIEIFGLKLKTPIYSSALSGFNKLSDTALTEIATGVKNAGSLMMLGIGGSADMREAADAGVRVIKIIKPYRKEELIYRELKEAEAIGCIAVGMDIDHFHGVRGRDDKLLNVELFGPQSTEKLQHIISSTKLPFIIKGVLHPDDAKEAVRMGASAIVVSSHLWSTVDFAIPPIVALPEIISAVGNTVPVLIDTGFKTGNDVMKALALGAKAVGFASSILLAWGAGGAACVEDLINQLTEELRRTMASTRCSNIEAIDSSVIIKLTLV
jgi:4-hydroxymandelate oxidase